MPDSLDYFLDYQQRWIDDDTQEAIVEKSRRIGLTYAESYRSVERRVKLGTDHLFASRTKETSAEFIRYCKMWLGVFGVVAEDLGEQVYDRDSDLKAHTLLLSNGARILALSSHPDAFRGFGGDVTLDEFAFHRDQRALLKAARASAVVWGHQLRVISTHNGEGSTYNQIILDVRSGRQPQWSLHRITLEDAVAQGLVEKIDASREKDPQRRREIEANPDLDRRAEFIDKIRSGCSADEWAEEYCCIPNTDAGAYLTYDLIDGCVDRGLRLAASIDDLPDDEAQFFGYDVGRRHDLCVLWVTGLVGDVLHTRMLTVLQGEERRFSHQERLLDGLLRRPAVRRGCIDQTGMGEQLAEQRAERFPGRVEGVVLSGPRKLAIAAPFKGLFEDRRIRIPDDDALREDLHKTRKTLTKGGNVRLEADRDEAGHADRFWAGALMSDAAITPSAVPAPYLPGDPRLIGGAA